MTTVAAYFWTTVGRKLITGLTGLALGPTLRTDAALPAVPMAVFRFQFLVADNGLAQIDEKARRRDVGIMKDVILADLETGGRHRLAVGRDEPRSTSRIQ